MTSTFVTCVPSTNINDMSRKITSCLVDISKRISNFKASLWEKLFRCKSTTSMALKILTGLCHFESFFQNKVHPSLRHSLSSVWHHIDIILGLGLI